MDVLDFTRHVEHSDPSLYVALETAINVTENALRLYRDGELCFSFNGGKDCTVVFHLLRAAVARRAARLASPGPGISVSGASAQAAAADGPKAARSDQHAAAADADGTPSSTASAAAAMPSTRAPTAAVVDAAESGDAGAQPLHNDAVCGHVRVVYFESPNNFPDVIAFMDSVAAAYGFTVERLPRLPAGLHALVSSGVRAVLMGTRRNDPDGGALDHFTPTSLNWPPCMRINPVLHWSYRHIWAFLRGLRLPYCHLYNDGYTSLGSVHDSIPNPLLRLEQPVDSSVSSASVYKPAWELTDERYERHGRKRRGGAVVALPAEPAPSATAEVDSGTSSAPASVSGDGAAQHGSDSELVVRLSAGAMT